MQAAGRFESCSIDGAATECTLLEALDKLNDTLVDTAQVPVAFAACPSGSADLVTGANFMPLILLPTTSQERGHRAVGMPAAMDEEFGPCSVNDECVSRSARPGQTRSG
jgi:hypothetical protein